MRLIDADELMESIRKALGIKSMPKSLLLPAERTIIDQIDSAPTAVGWISVKDRLPPEYSDCIVFADGYSQPAQCLDDGGFYTPDRYEEEKINGVTHWMSYPEGPKEEHDEP